MIVYPQEEKARKDDQEAKKKADEDARKKLILSNLTFTGYKVMITSFLMLPLDAADLRQNAYSIAHITSCAFVLTNRHRRGPKGKRRERRRRRS